METGKIIDGILILVFIISFYKGYKRGIFKILSQTISWICGMLFCRPFAQIIHNFCGNIFYRMFYRMLGSVNISDVNPTSGSVDKGIEMSVEFIAEKFSYSLSILLAFIADKLCCTTIVCTSVFNKILFSGTPFPEFEPCHLLHKCYAKLSGRYIIDSVTMPTPNIICCGCLYPL